MTEKPTIGISSCLLGEKVRYDAGHKLDHYLADTLGQFVQWVPVCPEVEYGLPVPREAMRLVGDPANPRLLTRKTGIDHTDGMTGWATNKIKALEKLNLCGFIFKSRSPSSGMKGVKIYTASGMPSHTGTGIFASVFMKSFSLVPVEDDGRLHDPGLRENFIQRVFTFMRWRQFLRERPSIRKLIAFHETHKLLVMSHSIDHLIKLGRLVAKAKEYEQKTLFENYILALMDSFKLRATVRKNVNVLHHIMGYFKQNLSAHEKQELLEIISHYHQGYVPLIVPVTLLNHYVKKFDEPYLEKQLYLKPAPVELMLRNHV